jgi:hypothetical protein
MAKRTAVFNPAYEKSHVRRFWRGTVNENAFGFPLQASLSNAAPPEGLKSNPSNRATLSYASPANVSIQTPVKHTKTTMQ